jgi:serine/threonine protein kinase
MLEPSHIGKYQVVNVLGRGAFGVVYRCIDPGLDRIVAIKVLLAAEHASSEILERFDREAKTAAKLSHPHIVQVYDVGTQEDRPYLVMEYVEGRCLDQLIRTSPWDLMPALQLLYHLAEALAYSHEQGVIHRDIKPANIIVDQRGRPKLTDFGLARLADEARWLSTTGDLLGTPRYMSPEQALLPSEEVDHRADLYSLGAIFYELLANRPLVDGPTPLATLKDLTDGKPKPLESLRPELPEACIAICNQMIAKDRKERMDSASQIAMRTKELILQLAIGGPEIASLARLDIVQVAERRPLQSSVPVLLPDSSRTRFPSRLGESEFLSKTDNRPRTRPVAFLGLGGAMIAMLLGVFFALSRLGPWAAQSSNRGNPQPVSQGQTDWQTRIDVLASTRDDRQYHSQWNELREELNSAVRRNPNDQALRTLRAPLLARNGDFIEALEDWGLVKGSQLTPSVMRSKLHAMAVWEKLFVGSIAEETISKPLSNDLRNHLKAIEATPTEHAESARNAALAKWLRIAIHDESLEDDAVIAELPTLPKQDPAFVDVQTWRSCSFLDLAHRLHNSANELPEEERASRKRRRDYWDQQALQAIREGLEMDTHHLGLLFLRTYRATRRFDWDTTDGMAWPDAERKHRSTFDSAFQRFRTSPSRLGFETAYARAVLLDQFGRSAAALDQLNEVVDRSGAPTILIAFWAWLQLNHPSEETIEIAISSSLLKTTEAATEGADPLFATYFVRSMCQASVGKWAEAKLELVRGKTDCNINDWGEVSGGFHDWLSASEASAILFRDRTVDAIWRVPSAPWVRKQMQEDIVNTLTENPEEWTKELSEIWLPSDTFV